MLPDRQAHVLAAANAAASWIRARRTLWDQPQLAPGYASGDVCVLDESPEYPVADQLDVLAAVATPVDGSTSGESTTAAPPSRVLEAIATAGPRLAARAAAWRGSLGAPLSRAMPGVLALAALAITVTAGFSYRSRATAWLAATTPKIARTAGGNPLVEGAQQVTKPTGGLRISSDPTGAKVRADGVVRGVTPLTLDNLAAGVHAIVFESAQGSVRKSVTIKAGETSEINEVIFAGWLTIFSPFELTITEDRRAIRLDQRNMVMLSPGSHELTVENRTLGYRERRRVDMRPGETTSLSVVPPHSTLSVSANEAADVWLDGVQVGRTPLTELPAELGTRELVLRNASGEERRLVVTATVKPAHVAVDFSKPGR